MQFYQFLQFFAGKTDLRFGRSFRNRKHVSNLFVRITFHCKEIENCPATFWQKIEQMQNALFFRYIFWFRIWQIHKLLFDRNRKRLLFAKFLQALVDDNFPCLRFKNQMIIELMKFGENLVKGICQYFFGVFIIFQIAFASHKKPTCVLLIKLPLRISVFVFASNV